MMPNNPAAYDAKTREFSMKRALAILDGLRGGGAQMRKASEVGKSMTVSGPSLIGRRMVRVEDGPLLRWPWKISSTISQCRTRCTWRSCCAVRSQHGRLKKHRRQSGQGRARRTCGADLRRPAAFAHQRPHPAIAAVRSDPLPRRSDRAGEGRGHLRGRAGGDGGGGQPPRRRGRAGADRVGYRGAAGGDRSVGRAGARRDEGAARLPRQPGGAASDRLRRH